MPDLKADAAAARIDAANLQAFGAHDVTAILRLADMVDRLTDTEGLAKSIIEALGKADDTAWIGALQSDNPDPLQSCCLDGSFNMIDAAQAVQDYVRGE